MIACGSGGEAGDGIGSIVPHLPNAKVSLTIGSKNFPEQEILGEIYAQALQAAGYKVKSDLDLGSGTAARQAVKSGAISGYPEYASTALASFFDVKPGDVPGSATMAWEQAKEAFEEEGLTAFWPAPFARADAVGTTAKFAKEEGLKTIFDLKGKSKDMVIYGPPRCRRQIDCLARLENLYGFKFKSFHPIDPDLRYVVLENGQADLSILTTTDPRLSAEKDKFVILEDEEELPAGNTIFVSKKSMAEQAGPDYERTIIEVQQGLTLQVVQALDARVQLEGQTPREAAAAYLKSAGYVG